MPIRTQAVVVTEPNRVELRTVSIPDPEPHEILARTLVSGISVGTERHYITGAYDQMGERVAQFYPFVTGYQRCAIVERVGADVEGIRVGDRVLMGKSRLLEPELDSKGRAGHVGYGVLDAQLVYRLPSSAETDEAALWVMVGVGLHGARLTRIDRGEKVAAIGLGMIGQLAAQAARLRGARVLAHDRTMRRVELGGRHSADRAFGGDLATFVETVRTEWPEGADVVIDSTSRVEIWPTCLDLIHREGRVNLQGYYPGAFRIDSHRAHVHRVTAVFPSGYDDPHEIARVLGERRFAVKPLITHHFPAAEATIAFDLVQRAPYEIVGAVIDWT